MINELREYNRIAGYTFSKFFFPNKEVQLNNVLMLVCFICEVHVFLSLTLFSLSGFQFFSLVLYLRHESYWPVRCIGTGEDGTIFLRRVMTMSKNYMSSKKLLSVLFFL